uniref:ANK_REP_REGION domain-containing protein n=1 Tax=Macrostomum lignano TaxID=282301 RepID=A0A1I8FLX6_9PLAT
WLVALCSSPADCGREGIVQILLKKHARVDVFDTNNHANVVRSCLRMNAFVNAKSKECYHTAAPGRPGGPQRGGETAPLKQDGVEVDARTLTPYIWPLRHDKSHVVKMFLRKKDIVTLASAKGMTCAHIAASKGSISVINELLRSNRSLLCTGKIKTNGCTALHLAAQEGHEKVVRLLVEAGASPSEENSEGLTPLHLAAQSGHS